VQDIDEIPDLFRSALATALPVPFSKTVHYFSSPPIDWYPGQKAQLPEVWVAFARFELENKPVAEAHPIAPNLRHDLELDVTVSDWPANAEKLVIDALSKEPHSTYHFPTFEFPRPQGDAPFRLRGKGRLILHGAHSLFAAPIEFTCRACFEPEIERLEIRRRTSRRAINMTVW
jgi:hypothetical protein